MILCDHPLSLRLTIVVEKFIKDESESENDSYGRGVYYTGSQLPNLKESIRRGVAPLAHSG